MGAEAITRRRGGTQGRHHERGSTPIVQRRPVVRRIADYEYFTEEGLELIHEESMTILEEIGIEFRYEPAIKLWREAGADVRASACIPPRPGAGEDQDRAGAIYGSMRAIPSATS